MTFYLELIDKTFFYGSSKKIRDAELSKIPYMIIVGEKEIKEQLLSVREHGGNNLGMMKKNQFKQMINQKINEELK